MIEIIPNWHPIFVHFTVSTLSLASVFYLVTYILVIKNNQVHHKTRQFADWNLWLGAVFAIITVIAGWLAYNTVAHDTPSHEAMTDHRNWALATTAVFLVIAIWSIYRKRVNQGIKPVFMLLVLIAFFLLGSTAWRGGEAVYRYGLGVMSLPKVEEGSDGHDHAHEGDNDHNDIVNKTHIPETKLPQSQDLMNQHDDGDHANHQH